MTFTFDKTFLRNELASHLLSKYQIKGELLELAEAVIMENTDKTIETLLPLAQELDKEAENALIR